MKTKMKDDPEDIPMAYLWYVVLAIMAIVATAVAVAFDCFKGPERFASLTIRFITGCVNMRHVTLDIYIFASGPRRISYPRIRIQSVHCIQNRVGTTSILTFAPSVSVLTFLRGSQ